MIILSIILSLVFTDIKPEYQDSNYAAINNTLAGFVDGLEGENRKFRVGNIVSIDFEGNTGSAKLEVYFPEDKKMMTTYLLLLKDDGVWGIREASTTEQSLKEYTDFRKSNLKDLPAIQSVVKTYAKGEAALFEKVIHEESELYVQSGLNYEKLNKDAFIENQLNHAQDDYKVKVLSLDYEDQAGMAKIQSTNKDTEEVITEYLLMHKIDKRWKVVNRSAYEQTNDFIVRGS